MTFFGRNSSLFEEVLPNVFKKSFLNSPNFFLP